MRWPTDNPHVSSGYGPRAPFPYHHGADFPYPVSGELYAILDYEVVWTGWRALGGWTAALRFSDGNVGWYQHLARASTITGRGREGDVVGVMGTTGLLTTGIHLHFELRRPDGFSFDPIPYLRAGTVASIPDVKPFPQPETPREDTKMRLIFITDERDEQKRRAAVGELSWEVQGPEASARARELWGPLINVTKAEAAGHLADVNKRRAQNGLKPLKGVRGEI